MNFVDLVVDCYTRITSHASQAFASYTHYTSYSLLNIVHVIVCVFGLTNQVCKYFEFLCKADLMLENLWKMFDDLNFWKTGFKIVVFEKHFITYSCILFINFIALRCFLKCVLFFFKIVFFSKFCEPLSVSIDPICFSINQKCFKIFKEASVCFDWSKLILDQSKLFWNYFKNF